MNSAGPSNSPTPARPSDATDEQLSAELKKWSGATPALQPVGELLDRHWEAAFAYARLCTDGPRPAGMLTTAAFTRLFGESLRQTGPSSAWRPHLLVTVRRIAAEWDTDHRREQLHPELRTDGNGDRIAARMLPPANRRMLSGAFQRLPQSARCLLWHTEVEAEPLDIPAALLGLDEEGARVELGRARERLREECLQVHRELAPEQECRHYLRLLDVTYRRRGVDVDADLREHLGWCRHCRDTADQLHQFNEGLGVALAEAVLGWGAQAYVEARAHVHAVPDGTMTPPAPVPDEFFGAMPHTSIAEPAFAGENFAPFAPDAAPLTPPVPAGSRTGTRARSRGASRGSAHKSPRRASRRRASRRNLTVAVLTVSGLIVLPLVLWSSIGSSDGAPQADGLSAEPGTGSGTSTSDRSWVEAGDAQQGTVRGRLHNVTSGLCVGLVGGKAVEGAETALTTCSSDRGQQWSYEPEGLLRSADAPDLCMDSHLGHSVVLAPCTAAAKSDSKNIRYDFTLQGALVPRWDQDLALTPAATDASGALVLKNRDDSNSAQHWVIDTSKTDLQMEVVNWDADTTPVRAPEAPPAPKVSKSPSPTSAPPSTPEPTPSATPPTPRATHAPTPSYPYPTNGPSGSGGYGGGYGGYGGGYWGGGYGGYGGYGPYYGAGGQR
ncbi:ricin-type beta-trefoil lectin domain protein [Streptomyces sp. NPDC005263]|uniref:ricin-type beta-trefoil lectin domain protein n=1 Tax=Streptomyces sp. NPDC005263 TaxID=3364711 RepID=UPI0036A25F24